MNKLTFFSMALTFISLMLFWVMMSGFLDVVHLAMGVATVAGTMVFNYKLRSHSFFKDDYIGSDHFRLGQAIYYVFWMIGQIIAAGFHAARVIIRPHLRMEISIIKFKTDLPNSHAKMILGNSITLTPGTITMEIEDDEFTVHSLTPSSHEGIINDEMPRQVLKIFTKEERQVVSDVRITSEIQTK